MAEVMPPTQVDLEFLRDRPDVALQRVSRVQSYATPPMKDPLASFVQSVHTHQQCRWNRDPTFRVSTLRGIDFPVVHAPLHMENVALEIRPLDRKSLSDAQPRHRQE